jgi:hypothetical protein
MISGLLKLIGRFSCTGYQTDFEISGKAYFITDEDPASRKARRAQIHPGTFLLLWRIREIENIFIGLAY